MIYVLGGVRDPQIKMTHPLWYFNSESFSWLEHQQFIWWCWLGKPGQFQVHNLASLAFDSLQNLWNTPPDPNSSKDLRIVLMYAYASPKSAYVTCYPETSPQISGWIQHLQQITKEKKWHYFVRIEIPPQVFQVGLGGPNIFFQEVIGSL